MCAVLFAVVQPLSVHISVCVDLAHVSRLSLTNNGLQSIAPAESYDPLPQASLSAKSCTSVCATICTFCVPGTRDADAIPSQEAGDCISS